jgi:hypothetical protein
VGSYDLQEFNLYYITRYGLRPSKMAFLCQHAWSDKSSGTWPDHLAADKHCELKSGWKSLFIASSNSANSNARKSAVKEAFGTAASCLSCE